MLYPPNPQVNFLLLKGNQMFPFFFHIKVDLRVGCEYLKWIFAQAFEKCVFCGLLSIFPDKSTCTSALPITNHRYFMIALSAEITMTNSKFISTAAGVLMPAKHSKLSFKIISPIFKPVYGLYKNFAWCRPVMFGSQRTVVLFKKYKCCIEAWVTLK